MAENRYRFPVMESFEAAWQKVGGFKKTVWAVLGLIFLNGVIFGAIGQLFVLFTSPAIGIIPVLIGAVIQLILSWSLIELGIKRAKDQPVSYKLYKQMFNRDLFVKMIGLYFLQGLIVLITSVIYLPFVMLLPDTIWSMIAFWIWYVVAIYVIVRMYLGKAIVMDQGLNPWAAIKASVAATKGNVLRLLGFIILSVLVLLVSLIPLGIGLIWSLPFLLVGYGVAYKRMMLGNAELKK